MPTTSAKLRVQLLKLTRSMFQTAHKKKCCDRNTLAYKSAPLVFRAYFTSEKT